VTDKFAELKTFDIHAAMPERTKTILLVEDEEMVRNYPVSTRTVYQCIDKNY